MSHVVEGKAHKEFSYTLFVLNNALLALGIGLALYLLLPHSVWEAQWHSRWWKFLIAFLSVKLTNAIFEYFFHRYVLHKPTLPFLSYFYRSHTLHHALTRIGKRRTPSGKVIPCIEEVVEVVNEYPITKPEQTEASFFPWYSLVVFSGVMTPFFIALQWLMPSFPWFVGGNLAILVSLTLYEFVHAVEHWEKERWDVIIEHPHWGAIGRRLYSFHLRHHADIECNEGISGFFTLPLPDLVFGTFVLPKTLYIDGQEWRAAEFEKPVPYWLIRRLDKVTDAMVKGRRLRAQGAL